MVGLLVGAFLMGLAWLKLGAPEQTARPDHIAQSSAQRKEAGTQPERKSLPAAPQSEFEFFEKLPKQEVSVTAQPLALRDSDTPPEKTQPNKIYYLQIASFHQEKDAERLRAELALLGMEAHVNTVSVGVSSRHRVMVGPFTKTRDLQNTRKQLARHGYEKPLTVIRNKTD